MSNWRFNPETVLFLHPKRLRWPTFDMHHVKRILSSKYYRIKYLGAFWPVSLKDFLFPKKRKYLKSTFTSVIAPNAQKRPPQGPKKCTVSGLKRRFDKWYLFHPYTPRSPEIPRRISIGQNEVFVKSGQK